jgi:hypothetical protein
MPQLGNPEVTRGEKVEKKTRLEIKAEKGNINHAWKA